MGVYIYMSNAHYSFRYFNQLLEIEKHISYLGFLRKSYDK